MLSFQLGTLFKKSEKSFSKFHLIINTQPRPPTHLITVTINLYTFRKTLHVLYCSYWHNILGREILS